MTTELYWLTLTLLMTALFWIPYILDRLAVRGIWPALSDTKPEGGGPHSLWAQRAIKAHSNAVENLAIFVPAVLIAHVLGISTPATKMAVVVYFVARLAHFVVYTAGVPVVRTLTFAVAWGAQIVIIASILKWI
ncbi:MAG: MAPEG family protein [Hyphomicrobium sp.]|nr:MAPEG family protein [Hyphomicrobium sp.]